MIYIIVENRFHRLSQVLDTLGSLGENAIPTVFIASEFVILGVGEVLGYDLSISIHAETRDLGILTHEKRANSEKFAHSITRNDGHNTSSSFNGSIKYHPYRKKTMDIAIYFMSAPW